MPQITVRKIDASEPEFTVAPEQKGLLERIREKAFELFQRRGGADGSDLEDWLNAEREFLASESEVVEKNGAFELQLPVPGFDAKEVQVFVTRKQVTVQAEHSHKEDRREGDVRVSEFTESDVFRSFPLPAPINLEKVTAKLDKGVLTLTAAKGA
jgi:HSP20 family protein